MIMRQVELDVEPAQVPAFRACFGAGFAVLARQPGGVWFRLLQEAERPNRFIGLSAWTDMASMERGLQAPEFLWVMQGREGRPEFWSSPAIHTDFNLLDMVWGLKGPEVYPGKGRTVHHIVGGVGPGKWGLWRTYSRNFFATMGRQLGIASFEIYRPADGGPGYAAGQAPRFLVVRGFMGEADEVVAPGQTASNEVQFAVAPVEKYKLYEGAEKAVTRRCEVVEMVWGMEGAKAIRGFIEAAQPE